MIYVLNYAITGCFYFITFFKHKNLYVNKIINFILLKLYIKIVAELKRIKLTFLYF